VSSRHSDKFAPFGADTPRTPQCGAMLAETLTAAAHLEPDETTKSAKNEIWLGGLFQTKYQRLRLKKPTHRKSNLGIL
jgi:hypothetical protein